MVQVSVTRKNNPIGPHSLGSVCTGDMVDRCSETWWTNFNRHIAHREGDGLCLGKRCPLCSFVQNSCCWLVKKGPMFGSFAAMLDGSQRKTLLGIAQVVMLGELAVNQVLDHVVPVG
ncbi:hypothetical protein SAMN05216509_4642 [Pseudomonas sp. B10]|nr:hypothetical protein SAMN05216509_4642 [Pseudomonas sp. B10]